MRDRVSQRSVTAESSTNQRYAWNADTFETLRSFVKGMLPVTLSLSLRILALQQQVCAKAVDQRVGQECIHQEM